jgi:hypothetical protein
MPLELFALRRCERVRKTRDLSGVKLGNFRLFVGFEFLTAVFMKKCIFWDITLCISFNVSKALLATVSYRFLA